jgi:hypothetical protein
MIVSIINLYPNEVNLIKFLNKKIEEHPKHPKIILLGGILVSILKKKKLQKKNKQGFKNIMNIKKDIVIINKQIKK